jgi:hypothetical protein
MSPSLRSALKDLDRTTAALLETDTADLPAVFLALERRLHAVTRVTSLLQDPADHVQAALDGLESALRRGEEATRKALKIRQDIFAEWGQMNGIRRGLESGRVQHAHALDFSG